MDSTPTGHGYPVSPTWKVVFADHGLRAEEVFRVAELPESLFDGDEPRVSAAEYLRFWGGIEEVVQDPLFPLALAESMDSQVFSPPLFAALCSPNLETASDRLQRFKPLIAPLHMTRSSTSAGLELELHWLEPSVSVPQLLWDLEIVFTAKLARMGTRERIVPLSVSVPHPPTDRQAYEAYLGVPIGDGDCIRIVFSRADADRPFLTNNAMVWEAFEPTLRRRLSEVQGRATFAERTRAVLLEALPSGQPHIEAASRRLAVSSRTLQRRLRDEGTSFKDIVRKTREELARHYLSRTRLTATEIAYLLGFEEPTSFFRAFHEWTGQTPETLRQARIAEG